MQFFQNPFGNLRRTYEYKLISTAQSVLLRVRDKKLRAEQFRKNICKKLRNVFRFTNEKKGRVSVVDSHRRARANKGG